MPTSTLYSSSSVIPHLWLKARAHADIIQWPTLLPKNDDMIGQAAYDKELEHIGTCVLRLGVLEAYASTFSIFADISVISDDCLLNAAEYLISDLSLGTIAIATGFADARLDPLVPDVPADNLCEATLRPIATMVKAVFGRYWIQKRKKLAPIIKAVKAFYIPALLAASLQDNLCESRVTCSFVNRILRHSRHRSALLDDQVGEEPYFLPDDLPEVHYEKGKARQFYVARGRAIFRIGIILGAGKQSRNDVLETERL